MRFERVLDLAWRVLLKKKIVEPRAQREGQEVLMQVYAAGYDDGRREGSARNKKTVLQIKGAKVIDEFPSAAAAGRAVGTDRTNITAVCLGKRITCKGYIWKYK